MFNFRRRLATALVIATMALGLFGSGTALAASGGSCVDFFANNDNFAGETQDLATSIDGAYAEIDPPSDGGSFFFNCGAPGTGNDGISAWVALVPGSGNSHYGDRNAILQIGVINCDGLGAQCDNTNHIFWAAGGCNFNTPVPVDLGETDDAMHTFNVAINGTGTNWLLKMDGTTLKNIAMSDPAVNCWDTGDVAAQIMAERKDRGDSAGANGNTSQRLRMHHLRSRYSGGYHDFTNAAIAAFNQADGSNNTPGQWQISASHNDTLGTYFHCWTIY